MVRGSINHTRPLYSWQQMLYTARPHAESTVKKYSQCKANTDTVAIVSYLAGTVCYSIGVGISCIKWTHSTAITALTAFGKPESAPLPIFCL